MKKQDRVWLEHIATMSRPGSGMYPGDRCDLCPEGPMRRLRAAGLITTFIPHNPEHKERWVITEAGRTAIATGRDET